MNAEALLIIDMQNDFMPGGPLGVPGGDEIIPLINDLMEQFSLVVATQDWHPKSHMSFASTHQKQIGEVIEVKGVSQMLWPEHCIQNSLGAQLVDGLNLSKIDKIIQKGMDIQIDSYSAFFDNAKLQSTGLEKFFNDANMNKIFIVGVATDYCVKFSALDALECGFETAVMPDACRAVNVKEGDENKALSLLSSRGIDLLTAKSFIRK